MYYYFCASLPALDLGEKPTLSLDGFLADCRRLLAPGDISAVEALLADDLDGDEPETGFARRRRDWEIQLRNAVTRWRAGRLNMDAGGYLHEHAGFDCSLEKDVADACARSNPLEREMALDRLRWRYAEDAARDEPFGLPAVMAFALKLRLAWRWAGLEDEPARKVLDELVESIEGGR